MERIKIGQIGVGHAHAGGKMQVYRNSSDFEVVGIVEPDPRLRAQAEKSPVYAGLSWLTEEELFDTPGLKAVAVETEVKHLLTTARRCVDRGLHIHLDKPAGSDLTAYRQLLDEAAMKHLAVQMGYMFRFSPAVQLLHDFLKVQALGEIFEVHAVMSKVVPAKDRKGLAEYPGGIMFELGCHVLDLVVAVLGKPDSVDAYSRHVSTLEDGLLDNQLAVLGYAKGVASVRSTAVEVDGFQRRQLTVCGTNGTFHIQPLDAPSVQWVLEKPVGRFPKGRGETVFGNYPRYVGDAKELAEIIRGKTDPQFGYDHDYHVQQVVMAASGLAEYSAAK